MMCLDRVYKGKEKKEALAKLPESGYYWKTVTISCGEYFPICSSLPNNQSFKNGWNQAKRKYIGKGYNVAFHLDRSKTAAERWIGTHIRCIIKKKDIVAIGMQDFNLTIVTSRFWMPKPKRNKFSFPTKEKK